MLFTLALDIVYFWILPVCCCCFVVAAAATSAAAAVVVQFPYFTAV
jgi:hypothetical protein